MIHDDQEMEAAHERIACFQRILADLRVTARPEEFRLVANGAPRNPLIPTPDQRRRRQHPLSEG